ncbi:MAG: glycoside hydrolase family 1 protein [Candidatus Paceibacterota bacterium]
MKLIFPEGFYWGASTASYQVEGGIDNNDWARAGREKLVPEAGVSSDHYHHFEEDFDIAKDLGHTAHRFSIEWSRIEPKEGEFDEKEIEHYREVFKALHKRNIRPFVTLWHFTLPLWLTDKGGVTAKEFPHYFARYGAYVVSKLGDACTDWITINEPLVFAQSGWLRGVWPPFQRGNIPGFMSVQATLVKAHIEAYKKIKAISKKHTVGIVKDNIYFHAHANPLHKILVIFLRWFWNRRFLNKIHTHVDVIGLNYYFHTEFGGRTVYPKTDMGWDIYPEGIYHTLMELKRYEVPVYIAESGIADADDSHRAQFIKSHLRWCHKALEDGVDVRGYMYWSLLDNFEWVYGYKKRFGLVGIDYKTKERTVRPSAHVYRKICESNMLEL